MSQLSLNTRVTYSNKSVNLQSLYFQGTRYRVFASSESNILIKVYDQGQEKYLRTELQAIMLLKSHTNIINAQEGEMQQSKVIVLEKAKMLQNILKDSQRGLQEPEILKILLDLSKGLKHCHQLGLTHRDIRPENVVIGLDEQAKLWNFQRCSFQSYAHVPVEYQQRVREELEMNTFAHVRAPEQNDQLFKSPITEKVDIYALGQLMYYMIYNVRYDQNPNWQINLKWGSYSEKLQQLVRMLLVPIPGDRMTADQVEKHIQNMMVQTPMQLHIRSRSSNERASREMASQRSERDKFNPIEFVDLAPKTDSNLYTNFLKQISKFAQKTDGWVAACLEEVDAGPKQKYLRFLVVKAWDKKNKIQKFYNKVSKRLQLSSVIISFKTLLLIHNYTKKGPQETMTIEDKEYSPLAIISKIKNFQINFKGQNKDKLRTQYMITIINQYSGMLTEKIQLCQLYRSYLEGNYSLNPFFNNLSNQASRGKIGIKMVQQLIQFWQKLNKFVEFLLQEQTLINLQFSLSLCMIDELYNLLSTCTHLLFALKNSTNYTVDSNPMAFQNVKEQLLQLQENFTFNFLQTSHYFSKCQLIPQLQQVVPQPSKNVIDIIKSIPLFSQQKGEFNIFDYLNYTNSIDGIRLPQSYGETLTYVKIENDDTETINLEPSEEKYSTIQNKTKPTMSLPQTLRDNRFVIDQNKEIQSFKTTQSKDTLNLSKQQSSQSSAAQSNTNIQDIIPIQIQNTPSVTNINTVEIKRQTVKKTRPSLTQGQYQDLSLSDEDDDGSAHHTPKDIKKPNLREQLAQDDFLALPTSNGKRIQSAQQNPQNIKSNEQFGFDNASYPQIPQQQKQQTIFDQFIPSQQSSQEKKDQNNYFKPQQFEIHRFITEELKKNTNEWVIPFEQISIDRQIGTGSSCDVYKGFWRGSEVAIKKMKIKSLTENHLKEFRREITALVTIKPHQNLVQLMGISQKEDDLYIVTEYCSGGTVFDLLHRKKHIEVPWGVRLKMALQVASGMQYLHELTPPLIHRDLKSLNLLLESQYEATKMNIKIADFGLARAQLDNGEAMTGVLGTFHWMAPEIFECIPYSTKADVFSFGIVLWEICSRETPYKNLGNPHVIMKYVTIDKGRPDLSLLQNGCPLFLKELMIKCWDHDPSKRPRFQEIIGMIRSKL